MSDFWLGVSFCAGFLVFCAGFLWLIGLCLIGRRLLPEKQPELKPGDVYVFADGNPFRRFEVTVINTKEGWVQYRIGSAGTLDALEIKTFLNVYTKHVA